MIMLKTARTTKKMVLNVAMLMILLMMEMPVLKILLQLMMMITMAWRPCVWEFPQFQS